MPKADGEVHTSKKLSYHRRFWIYENFADILDHK